MRLIWSCLEITHDESLTHVPLHSFFFNLLTLWAKIKWFCPVSIETKAPYLHKVMHFMPWIIWDAWITWTSEHKKHGPRCHNPKCPCESMYTRGNEHWRPLSAGEIQNIKKSSQLFQKIMELSAVMTWPFAEGDSGNIQSEGYKRALSNQLTADP